jgi:hypothetical protein
MEDFRSFHRGFTITDYATFTVIGVGPSRSGLFLGMERLMLGPIRN